MDKDLKALFQILQKRGIFKTEESMMAVIEAEGIEVLFPVMPEGMFNSVESFASAFPGAVKKKTNPNLLFKRTLWNPLHQSWRRNLSHRSLPRSLIERL